jgi:hypothetical protein
MNKGGLSIPDTSERIYLEGGCLSVLGIHPLQPSNNHPEGASVGWMEVLVEAMGGHYRIVACKKVQHVACERWREMLRPPTSEWQPTVRHDEWFFTLSLESISSSVFAMNGSPRLHCTLNLHAR